MGSFDDSAWDLPLDYFIDDVASPNFSWVDVDPSSNIDIDFCRTGTMIQEQESERRLPWKSSSFAIDFTKSSSVPQEQEFEMECSKKSSSFEIAFSQTSSVLQEQESEMECAKKSSSFEIDFSQTSSLPQEQDYEMECPKKRGRVPVCSRPKSKASRERERREKLNESFLNLSSVLEPERAAKTDKLAVLSDAIKVVQQLRHEAEGYKEENKKLQEEIESLKAEKSELRDEKSTLKAEKEKMELQFKAMAIPGSGLIPPFPPAYQAGPNKMALYPGYGMYPMWHYLPPSTRDTSHDHELRPPAA